MATIPYSPTEGEELYEGTKDFNPMNDAYDAATPDEYACEARDISQFRNFCQYIRGVVASCVIQPVTSLLFDTTASVPTYAEGIIYYDNVNKCMAVFNDEEDITLQVGQEMFVRVYNDTGSIITNGSICYLSGTFGTFPTAALADASDATKCLSTLGFATHDIEDSSYGYITISGMVRGLDTSGCSEGQLIYLSSTTPGTYTNTVQISPAYNIIVGNCSVVNATTGSIFTNVTVGSNTQDTIKIYNGSILEDHTTEITSDGTTVTMSLEKTGGGDLSLFFNGGFYEFDSTPAATIALTAGTDTTPILNYVYVPEDTKVLTISTTGFDESQQRIPIATILCQSAASVQTYGVYKHHAWTDHLSDSVGQGHISHLNNWIRNQNATWLSGSLLTATGGANTFDIATTTGSMLQLHKHTIAAQDTSTGDSIYVVNDSTTAYNRVSDLTTTIADSEGDDLTGRYYSVVIWISGSEDQDDDKLYCNLPSGSYGNSSDAIEDLSAYTNYSIPTSFKGVGILLARVVVRNQTGSGGTFTVEQTDDLRGLVPAVSAGGSGGGGGAENFTDLLDVPSSYTGESLKAVRVNSGETALEFYTPTSGGGNTVQSITSAATITPVWATGNIGIVSALAENITVNNSVVDATAGTYIELRFVQNATGGFSITLGSDYILLDNNSNYDTSPNAVTIFSGTARADGTIEGGFSPVESGNYPAEIIVAASDETTALTTGTGKVTFRMPHAMTLSGVRASVTTAPTGSVLTVDINESGTSILSTKLTIDATEKTSTTAATAAVISDSSLADDAEMTIDIDGIGSTIAGAGLKITFIGTRA